MEVLYRILFFTIGLFFGSFFCVVGMRLGREEDFIRGHSHCDHCSHPLAWYDLIPLFSFLSLKGRCRYCKAKIHPLIFFIELSTAILFMVSYYSFGNSSDLLLALLVVSLTMIIMTSDFMYLMIPDEVLLFFAICFILLQWVRLGIYGCLLSIGSGVVLFLFMYALLCLGNFLFKKESLGGGDVKLLFVIGLVVDPFLGLMTIFLASFMALPISLFLYQKHHEKIIPFGPFLLIALLILLFSKITTTDILSFLENYALLFSHFVL